MGITSPIRQLNNVTPVDKNVPRFAEYSYKACAKAVTPSSVPSCADTLQAVIRTGHLENENDSPDVTRRSVEPPVSFPRPASRDSLSAPLQQKQSCHHVASRPKQQAGRQKPDMYTSRFQTTES